MTKRETSDRIVGLCTVISVANDLSIITYVLDSYELALAQAIELQNGVKAEIFRDPETSSTDAVFGTVLRETLFRIPELDEIVAVRETTVGEEILSVPLD